LYVSAFLVRIVIVDRHVAGGFVPALIAILGALCTEKTGVGHSRYCDVIMKTRLSCLSMYYDAFNVIQIIMLTYIYNMNRFFSQLCEPVATAGY
jgi:hypothetical protein